MTSKALEAAKAVAFDLEREGYITEDDVIAIITAFAENITDGMAFAGMQSEKLCSADSVTAFREGVKAGMLKGLEP